MKIAKRVLSVALALALGAALLMPAFAAGPEIEVLTAEAEEELPWVTRIIFAILDWLGFTEENMESGELPGWFQSLVGFLERIGLTEENLATGQYPWWLIALFLPLYPLGLIPSFFMGGGFILLLAPFVILMIPVVILLLPIALPLTLLFG